jgi:hypothetical protein
VLTHLMRALVFVVGSGGGVSTVDGVGRRVVDAGDQGRSGAMAVIRMAALMVGAGCCRQRWWMGWSSSSSASSAAVDGWW